MDNTNSQEDNDLMLCKQEDGEYINDTSLTEPPQQQNIIKYDTNYQQDDIISQLAGAGTVGVAAAAAILSSKHNSRHNYHFETNPAVRKRQQTRLLRKLNELADEYAARCGQQICVMCCTPTKVITKQTIFKVFGTQPLETVVKNQRSSILGELDNLLKSTIIDDKDNNNQQQQQLLNHHDEDTTTTTTPSSSTSPQSSRYDLPSLNIDGIPTSLETMTQCQLRMFIPLLLKYSTGRQKPGWNRIECKPVWWPAELPWANIRVDPRDEDAKKKHPWTEVLKQVIRNCYKYHGREDLLHKFNNIESTVSTKQNKVKKSILVTPSVIESKPLIVHQQQQQQQSNHYTVLQQVRNLDGSLTVIPINTLNLPQVDVCQYKSQQLQVDNTNRLDGSPIILHTDSADSMNTANQLHALTQANPTILDFNMNEYLWNHQTQQQDGNGGNSSILITNSNNHHYDLLVDDVGDVEDEQSKEDNIIELACINKKLKREFNDTTNNTSVGVEGSSSGSSSNNNNDYNELQLIKHKRYRLCSSMMKSIDQINDNKK
jgi:hypothetical protein